MIDLPLNPFPSSALPALREAKAQLDLPLVKPRQARYGDARVVATDTPDFLCEYALIGNDIEGTKAALEWAVGGKDDYRAKGFADLLSVWMGGEVRELESEGPRVVFRRTPLRPPRYTYALQAADMRTLHLALRGPSRG